MTDLGTIPLNTIGDARIALGEASTEINQAYKTIAGFQGDTSGIRDLLDVAAASTNGLYATLPATALTQEIDGDTFARVLRSLGSTQIALDAVSDEAPVDAAVSWDLGGNIRGLLHDTAGLLGDTLNDLAAPIAKAANTLLTPVIWAAVILTVLIVILVRNGATLGGML